MSEEDASPTESSRPPRIAYLYSRYPVVSQTFCDSEMLELEARGAELTIASLNPPADTFRHERHRLFEAEVLYPPPSPILRAGETRAHLSGLWENRLEAMVERHHRAYGERAKAAVRARNALHFAHVFKRRGIDHIHVHFANRATHTALFIKQLTGIPFSFTAHAQDFMVDLDDDELLREMCREAKTVVAVSDWSRDLLARTCPDSADKIVRVYNGIRLSDFSPAPGSPPDAPLRLISIGRLIEFKGFHHLLAACATLKERGVAFECTIIGEGPWKKRLLKQRDKLRLTGAEVHFAGLRTQEQVVAMLAESDVFVLPCVVDSQGASDILPTVIMEAMAASLPVVSTDLVGVPEMVENGVTGITVQPADADALADALQQMAGEPETRRNYGEAGRERCRKIFSREETTGRLLRHFDIALPDSKPARTGPAAAPMLYVVDVWPAQGDPLLEQELHFLQENHPEVEIVACRAPESVDFLQLNTAEQDLLETIQYLPDAMVLEANWLHDPEAVQALTRLRAKLTSTVSTERYFIEARRALELASLLRKRGIERIHAARTTSALACWMAYRLGAAEAFSFAAEADPFLDAKILKVLQKDADVASRADQDDELALAPPPRRHLILGPVKIRTGREPAPDRIEVLRHWMERLLTPASA